MKKLLYFGLCLFSLLSCADYDPEEVDIKENAKEVFGINFGNNDWCTAFSGVVHINGMPQGTVKIKLMALNQDEEGSYMTILNECDNPVLPMMLSYDAPKDNLGLYVAYISESSSYTFNKIIGNELSSEVTVELLETRSHEADRYTFNLPQEDIYIKSSEESYSSLRGWNTGELLYQYICPGNLVEDFSESDKEALRFIVFSYFKNGRNYNNLPLVKQTGYYNESVYPITTGEDPILVSPIYRNDGIYKEIENSDLYYYYFKESDIEGDTVSYLESLPKYKAIELRECIKDNDVICKHITYALLYWGDDKRPEIGKTKGSLQFPKGYKIGFMIRANTTAEECKKQGELYGDGRLNNHVNNYGNFRSSKLGINGPRMAWLTVNNRMLLCCESGTDADFNDIIFKIDGGLEELIYEPDIDPNYYTFCFEDHRLGDYDMNDLVIKGRRISDTKVEYTLMACGGADNLYLYNIEGKRLNQGKEVHEIFGKPRGTIINAMKHDQTPYIKDTINVKSDFSFLDPRYQPVLYNKTMGWEIYLSESGQDPHAIMIPYDFKWPLEGICINKAYQKFNDWGIGVITSTDWFKHPEEDKIY